MLPKIGQVLHDLYIPSTGDTIQFRPFIVKEHKALLQALELGSPDVFVNTISDIVESCVQQKIDVNKLTQFDVDFIFLNIRAKSVGEMVPVKYTCLSPVEKQVPADEDDLDSDVHDDGTVTVVEPCNTQLNIELNLGDVKVIMPDKYDKKRIVKFDENSGMKLKAPSFRNFRELFAKHENGFKVNEFEMNLLFSCVESIYQNNQIFFPVSDFNAEEFASFISEAPMTVLNSVNEFFDQIPYVALQTRIKCPVCGANHNAEIKNLEDFFV